MDLKRYLDRGFIFLMTGMGLSILLFFYTSPHDTAPFLRVLEFGIPAWFGVNAVERWAVDRVKAQNDGASGP